MGLLARRGVCGCVALIIFVVGLAASSAPASVGGLRAARVASHGGSDLKPAAPRAADVTLSSLNGDDPGSAVRPDVNARRYFDNTGYGADNEPYGPTDSQGCPVQGTVYGFDHTLWLRFTGTGGTVIIHSAGSDIRAGLAVYPADGVGTTTATSTVLDCDVTTDSAATIFVPTQAGREYLVQAGGLERSSAAGTSNVVNEGLLALTIITSDSRAQAAGIPLNSSRALSNEDASTDNGEPLTCGATSYGATIWLRFHVDAPGRATFGASVGASSAGLPVVAIFRGNDAAPLACGAADGTTTLRAQAAVDVAPGDYFVQIGSTDGYGGDFTYNLDYAENLDVDGDGALRPADCNDSNPTIRPGVKDVPNGIDDDCDGVVDPDADNDGSARPLDCNDSNPKIHPGAVEVPGNRVDENCDGITPPFATLNSRFGVTWGPPSRTTRLTRLMVFDVPAGATITVRCIGRGCPKKSYTKAVAKAAGAVSVLRPLKGRRLRPGVVVEVRVARADLVVRYTIRRGRAPLIKRGLVGDGYAPGS
jgi:Putative metal-binding motif